MNRLILLLLIAVAAPLSAAPELANVPSDAEVKARASALEVAGAFANDAGSATFIRIEACGHTSEHWPH